MRFIVLYMIMPGFSSTDFKIEGHVNGFNSLSFEFILKIKYRDCKREEEMAEKQGVRML